MELTKKEYEGAFEGAQDIDWEPIPEEGTSPMNQPVKEGEVSHGVTDLSKLAKESPPDTNEPNEFESQLHGVEDGFNGVDEPEPEPQVREPLDAPEQEVDADFEEPESQSSGGHGAGLHVPDEYTGLAADSIMGMASDYLELASGFFVKIKKRNEFYEFEEIIQRIDEQNERNVKRFRLDEGDRALLRPLIMRVLKARAQKLTPEQQLIAAIITILVKDTKKVFEIRSEIKQFEDHLSDFISQHKKGQQHNRPHRDDRNEAHAEEPRKEAA